MTTVVGYGVAVLVQIVVFPVFRIEASIGKELAIGLVFGRLDCGQRIAQFAEAWR
jgi:hypothetical protein